MNVEDDWDEVLDRLNSMKHAVSADQIPKGFFGHYVNSACGDTVILGATWDHKERIVKAVHASTGCIVCRTAADFLCQSLTGVKWKSLINFEHAAALSTFPIKTLTERKKICCLAGFEALMNAVDRHTDISGNAAD